MRANPDEDNYLLESRVRENRMHGSVGGEDVSPSLPNRRKVTHLIRVWPYTLHLRASAVRVIHYILPVFVGCAERSETHLSQSMRFV